MGMKKSNIPLPGHLTNFLDWLDIEKGLSTKTQENYSRFINRFFVWLKEKDLDKLKPHELTPEHVWDYRIYLSRQYPSKYKEPLKRSTQNYYLIALRSLLGYFVVKDIVSLAPDKINLGKDNREKVVKFLTLEQLNKLFSAPDVTSSQGLRDRAILESFFSSGMRIAELVSLNRDQIKVDSPLIKDLEISIIGKGSRVRTIYFSESSVNWLKKYLDTRKDKEKALFVNSQDPPVRLTPRAIEKNLKRYVVMAGLPVTTTPHVLRHSFATDLLAKGVDIRVVQEFLGHKNILATQIYTHVTNKQLRDIHRKFHSK